MSYIVINDTLGAATHLQTKDIDPWEQIPKLGVLLCDEHVITEFATRERAARAISRTCAYFARRGKPARQHEVYRIIRLVPEGLAR